MDTTMEVGRFSVKDELTINQVNPYTLELTWDILEAMLQTQPESYEMFHTLDSIREKIERGQWQSWVFMDKQERIGGAVFTSIRHHANDTTSLCVELACYENLYAAAKAFRLLAAMAEQAKFTYLEGMVHETIAEYATRKQGFTRTSVHVIKPLQPQRRN